MLLPGFHRVLTLGTQLPAMLCGSPTHPVWRDHTETREGDPADSQARVKMPLDASSPYLPGHTQL